MVAMVVVVMALFLLPEERQTHQFVWTSTYNGTCFPEVYIGRVLVVVVGGGGYSTYYYCYYYHYYYHYYYCYYFAVAP